MSALPTPRSVPLLPQSYIPNNPQSLGIGHFFLRDERMEGEIRYIFIIIQTQATSPGMFQDEKEKGR